MPLSVEYILDFLFVIKDTYPHDSIIDDVVHVPIGEVGVELAFFLAGHEGLGIELAYAYGIIVVDDVNMGGFLQSAKVVVEDSFEVFIPRIRGDVPEGD